MNEATNSLPDPRRSKRKNSDKVFQTRVDAWLVILVGLAIAMCFFQAWSLSSVASVGSLTALVVGILSAVTVLMLTVPCRYTLRDDHLFIHCGVIKRRILYSDIRGIELSSSPLSAPALSLRRVKISYGRSFQLVSPQERDDFIDELSKRCGLKRKII